MNASKPFEYPPKQGGKLSKRVRLVVMGTKKSVRADTFSPKSCVGIFVFGPVGQLLWVRKEVIEKRFFLIIAKNSNL